MTTKPDPVEAFLDECEVPAQALAWSGSQRRVIAQRDKLVAMVRALKDDYDNNYTLARILEEPR